MTTHSDYLKNMLEKIILAYENILNLKDLPGDLIILNRELAKIRGFFIVVLKKMEEENFQGKDIQKLRSNLRYYLKTYSFEDEITTMAQLYSEDTSRIKNLRLTILQSFKDKKIMQDIESTRNEI